MLTYTLQVKLLNVRNADTVFQGQCFVSAAATEPGNTAVLL